jgi:hypothetical protein
MNREWKSVQLPFFASQASRLGESANREENEKHDWENIAPHQATTWRISELVFITFASDRGKLT